MRRDPLRALIRVRRVARDEAQRELARALDALGRTESRVAELRQAMAREQAAAEEAADDVAVEAFGRWYRRARVELRETEWLRDRAEAEAGRLRAQLAAARAALEAAEREQARRAEALRYRAERRDQGLIDEAARRRPMRD
ncbi:MAG TPA: hypothetical protein VFA03_15325 [Acetobacteraceae bacterium]|nr:hypothetical protein [Acetobacteraceae bacterium]